MKNNSPHHRILSMAIRSFMLIQICLMIVSLDYLEAQLVSSTDVYPLGKHYTWTYCYQRSQSHYDNFGEGGSSIDSGIVIYSIKDSSLQGDSILWQIHMKRNIRFYSKSCLGISSCSDTTYTIIDSADFSIWESMLGDHHIYVDNIFFYGNPIWKFMYQFPDSDKIFRYQLADTQGISIINTSSLGYYPLEMPIRFTFKQDSGLTKLFGTIAMGLGGATINCTLLNATLTSIEQSDFEKKIQSECHLYQNFPNPFNAQTVIRYDLPIGSFVTLKILDCLGREISVLTNEFQNVGRKEAVFTGGNLSSGIYFYRLQTPGTIRTKSFIFIK